ncbi:MAG: 2-hydroxy-3-keto-5-methylthiopentenyl-1-phosphate phosphatase [Ignavibacteriae bacterium HGW-Ignavibacteriae-3]|nr:MAG: 2-hydroxy-3-keto-5-methylthiopentenyl-1-phosphate phosphatase [Ignavibacteriae bacterium HGW-Ignavibacteriae-3]
MNLNNRSYKIFVDFDGTITQTDVGEALFTRFGNVEKSQSWIDEWLNGNLSSIELWKLLCGTVDQINEKEYELFLNEITLDPDFKYFAQYCESEGFELRILSDGFDYYIDRILKREDLSHLEVYSNQLNFDADKKLIPVFPHTDEECAQCGNCKRNHILNFSGPDDYTFYIGDGNTDICPVQYCDFIFAKNSLLRYCEINRITYFPYSNFGEVIKKIEELKSKKRLKKRHQAELKRKEVFIQG